ncbi:GntR family transcriptional regulator [Clostridium sp. BJN0001]|uniref:GntR family transcriptional regulator n=1 Tax=Clostridium sp. BJN0001 TaxID=2930219 RepID=UPI001FD5C5EB|nr:GntR family transcriptional regulator [Clostridium sp. BJN0001]
MTWQFNGDKPIYQQIMTYIKLKIISGVYKPGDKLPTVRELANDAAVNPNTMQKALTELERENLVFSVRTTGRYITKEKDIINNVKKSMAEGEIRKFIKTMKSIGLSKEDIRILVSDMLKEM